MLANADSLDAIIRVELEAGNSQHASLRIARYACELSKCTESQCASLDAVALADRTPEDLNKLSAMALRLNAPGEEPLQLSRRCLDTGHVEWDFPTQDLEPGPWLIYPGKGCPVHFRPLLWTIFDDEFAATFSSLTLSDIMKIADEETRFYQLRLAVKQMSVDFGAMDWHTVEQLTNLLYNLPFCALDIWRAFSKSKRGLTALALRAHMLPSGFLERFTNEMPAIWEAIPLNTWVETMRAFIAFEEKQAIPAADLNSRVEAIASLHPSLRVLLEIAQTICTGSPTAGVSFALKTRWDFAKELFNGERSPYQRLLREGADATWPTDLQQDITKARSGNLAHFLHAEDPRFRDVVVNLPILLATSAAMNIAIQWTQIHPARILRKYQDFCPEWFDDAFDLTVARCISEGVIPELSEA
jgi:hypothetical protein